MNKNGFQGRRNDIDDLIYCGLSSDIQKPFQFISGFSRTLALQLAVRSSVLVPKLFAWLFVLIPCLYLQIRCQKSQKCVLIGCIR